MAIGNAKLRGHHAWRESQKWLRASRMIVFVDEWLVGQRTTREERLTPTNRAQQATLYDPTPVVLSSWHELLQVTRTSLHSEQSNI